MKTEEKLREKFEANPALFIEEEIKRFVRESPLNRLQAFDGEPIFEEPLVGFADGDDPIFQQYKTIIADFHLTPREMLTRHLTEVLGVVSPEVPSVSVICWVLRYSKEVRLSNRKETKGPSLRWNHGRWHGQDFAREQSRHVASLLEERGHRAMVPELSPLWRFRRLPNGIGSNWSQRHAAYAAGLGTFSLTDAFITPKGLCIRCNTVITDLKLPPTPRPYPNHMANCLFYVDGSCRRCMERCPGGAITEKGHDKERCRVVLLEEQKPYLEGAYGPGYIGDYAGCGLCLTKVPCEDRIPPRQKAKG